MSRLVEQRILEVLRRVGVSLQVPIEASALDLGDVPDSERDPSGLNLLLTGGRRAGIYIRESQLMAVDVVSLVGEGLPIIAALPDGSFWVFETANGKLVETSHIDDDISFSTISNRKLRGILKQPVRLFVAKQELECSSLSQSLSKSQSAQLSPSHTSSDHVAHPKPLWRFLVMLRLDQRDVWTIGLFALVAGILSLATPLAIESLVNVVSWGTYLQPLVVLAIMLLTCLGIAGILRVLQTIIVEIIQRRQLVRIVGDLSHRFARARQTALDGEYPRELANRIFDIMTIQKASAVLLLDGVSIVLTTILGMLLLAFYHPYLLGFDLVLLLSMLSITRLLGRGGIQTSIDESVVKYKIAHWLQDVIASPVPFKVNGGESLAVERANRLTTDYLDARQRQFRVVIRQVAFAMGLQVIASTALLGLGGWLVIQQQLTLGQLVASELVVTLVVSSFAKAGKSLEKFYDLMAGIDKIGHLLDIPVDARYEMKEQVAQPVDVRWQELSFHCPMAGVTYHIPSAKIDAGARVAITGHDRSGKSLLLKCLAGLVEPQHGMAEVNGMSAQQAALSSHGRMIGYAGLPQIFHATLQENVDLARSEVGQQRVREALGAVGLWDAVLGLPQGLDTYLQTDGGLLTRTQRAQLMIAQAIAGQPKLLLLDGVLDELTPEVLEHVWQSVAAPQASWTLLIVTNQEHIASRCALRLELESSEPERA
ncbi:MAG: ABC transporter ATP-binding protein [Planctomycetales bacterium]|nr:ABC transporter ATP-binding protein [Planctomycetales bacterium]